VQLHSLQKRWILLLKMREHAQATCNCCGMTLAKVRHRMPATSSVHNAPTTAFRDGLGERSVAFGPTGDQLEMLRLEGAGMAGPAFEVALRERSARLMTLRHGSYVSVCRIDRVPVLTLVSKYVEGVRLSDLLRVAHQRNVTIDIAIVMAIVRQLLAATALLHEHAPDVANGLIAPERLILAPQSRIAIAEQALCTAIEQLHYSPEQLWRELRIAVGPALGAVRFSHRTDLMNIGLVALALILGRPLADDDFPTRVPILLETARERSALGYDRPLPSPLRVWLTRVLQLEPCRLFATPSDAWIAFETVAAADPLYCSTKAAVEIFLQACSVAPGHPEAEDRAPVRSLQHGAHGTSTQAARTAHPEPALVSALTNPELRATMLPVDHVVDAGEPVTGPAAVFDWSGGAAPPAAVATAGEITQLFSNADLSWDGAATPSEPVLPSARELEFGAPASHEGVGDAAGAAISGPERHTSDSEMFQTEPSGFLVALNHASRLRMRVVAAAVVAILAGGVGTIRFARPTVVAASAMGTLRVDTSPAGLQVFVDGIEHGRTPARLSVPAGPHILEVRGHGAPHVTPIKVLSGADISQHLEFANIPDTGQLRVETDPAGATVIVDGLSRGTTPLTVTNLTPGDRQIELQTLAGTARHTVHVQAGATSSLKVPAPELSAGAIPTWGWVAVKAAFAADIRVGGRVLGATDGERIRMAAGRHQIEVVNQAQGYRSVRLVDVVPGKVTNLLVDAPPPGLVNVNASPWAEVWIGGRRIGETPLANVSIPAGQHEVVFRHPQLGEKRQDLSVAPGARVRLSMDMR